MFWIIWIPESHLQSAGPAGLREAGRADGKEIPSTTLERMISRNSDAAQMQLSRPKRHFSSFFHVVSVSSLQTFTRIRAIAGGAERLGSLVSSEMLKFKAYASDIFRFCKPKAFRRSFCNCNKDIPRREARPAPGGFGRIPVRCPFLERRRTGLAEECQAKAKATILKARSKL